MATVGYILLSAFLAVIAGISAPKISETLASFDVRLAIGLTVFIIVQFGIITPFRMWQQSVWVAKVENVLEELLNYHDSGVSLLNRHYNELSNPKLKDDPVSVNTYVNEWFTDLIKWTKDTSEVMNKLYPIEARRFKNIVTYPIELKDGLNDSHIRWRNMLLARLRKIDAVIDRHQPSILPE